MRALIVGLTGLVLLGAAPAVAADWETDKATCLGAYGALAHEAAAQAQWSSGLAKTNLLSIDWAGRRTKLLAGSPIYEAASKPYEDNFRQMLRKDRIDGVSKHTGEVIELSMRCDKAHSFSPSFIIPD